ncbi:MAG: GNAT family N-acetyltransferase [Candidatus Pristimantibacillus lignocellulolyticus]|uniref:GNAT family N-acetyltransferase n=1 Tax=Candidatus Pristimantibacillus lignocellulolyticus TaxID=2994561 RepID=A0A9J6Z9D8_9BACL|nr:MAG: GNAT family N-acetyltransferase [Candidatus Pristimantibacillus lignocellulolyticus]
MLLRHNSRTWNKQRAKILNFISHYGEKRITLATLHSLRLLSDEQLNYQPSSDIVPASVVTFSDQGKLMGVGYAIGDGSGHCLIVVRPEARRNGVGFQIMKELINSLDHFSCQVAIDNVASLALCFKNGLHAVSMFKGPTGKATLRFERSSVHGAATVRNTNTISQ